MIQSVRSFFKIELVALVLFAWVITMHLSSGRGHPDASPSDSLQYIDVARNLAAGHGYTEIYDGELRPHYFRTPGYPVFLAANMKLGGEAGWKWIAVGSQIILHVLAAFALRAVILQSDPKAQPASLAFAAYLLHPGLILACCHILSDSLFVSIMTLLLCLWSMAPPSQTAGYLIISGLTGLAMGLNTLIRPAGLPLGIAWGATTAFIAAAGRDRRLASYASCTMLAACSLIAPAAWMARNHAGAGRFALSPTGGLALVAQVRGLIPGWTDAEIDQFSPDERVVIRAIRDHEFAAVMGVVRHETGLNEFQVSAVCASVGEKAIRERPGWYSGQIARKAITLFFPGGGFLAMLNSLGIPPSLTEFGLREALSERNLPVLGFIAVTRGCYLILYGLVPLCALMLLAVQCLRVRSMKMMVGSRPLFTRPHAPAVVVVTFLYFAATLAILVTPNERFALVLVPSECALLAVAADAFLTRRHRPDRPPRRDTHPA